MGRLSSTAKNLIPGATLGVVALLASATLIGSPAQADNPACGVAAANYEGRIFHGTVFEPPNELPVDIQISNGVVTTTVWISATGNRVSHGPLRVTTGHAEWSGTDPVDGSPIVYTTRERSCDATVGGNPTVLIGLVTPPLGNFSRLFTLARELPNG
jgi:hypothetical protein